MSNKMLVFLFFGAIIPGFAFSNDKKPITNSEIIITHVTVVPMDTERILPNRNVLIRDGIIRKISTDELSVPKNTLTIDGAGKYLIPGLADLHVHLFSTDDLPGYITHGVTTVLNMDGGPLHLKWREEVRNGKRLGPTIYTVGHTIDGWPPLNELFLTAESPSDGRGIVSNQKHAGYDAIKLYGTIRPEVFRAILQAAETEQIPVFGHINRQVGAVEVLKSSQSLAAHLEDLLFSRFEQPPSDTELRDFADVIAASHITVTPNLNVNPANIAQLENLDQVLSSPDAALLSPAAFSQWITANNRNERNEQTAQQIEMMKGIQQILYKFAKLLQERSVPMVLGSDSAPYGFPGVSARQELQEIVDAGLSPYQALLTATRNAGTFISRYIPSAPHFGTVAEGAQADLLLLSDNPLIDIKNIGHIAGVMLRGKWLPAEEITSLRTETLKRSANVKEQLLKIDSDLESGDVSSARKYMQQYPYSAPWYSEWVLMTKARKLQNKNLRAAIGLARLDTALYPQSFSSWNLLGDLLFQDGQFDAALPNVRKSLAIEPYNSASQNLVLKIQALQQGPQFSPNGSYDIEYTNDQNHSVQSTRLQIERSPKGQLRGTKADGTEPASSLHSVFAGNDRLWAVADTQFGQIEFRIIVHGNTLTGYWAGPFGHNGNLRGTKSESSEVAH